MRKAQIDSVWRKSILFFVLICTSSFISAQAFVFYGGSSDGHSYSEYLQVNTEVFGGGCSDGFANADFMQSSAQLFKGDLGDGSSFMEWIDMTSDFYKGGHSDGSDFSEVSNSNSFLFVGGKADGSSSDMYFQNFTDIFSGGFADGYGHGKLGHIIVWKGITGTGWNVASNWANDMIPTHCNPVVIPSAVPNFPWVNAGVLKIGYSENDGDYNCLQLKIEQGADMYTRVNCFIENYNVVSVRGNLFVKNETSLSFQNWGNINIKSTGKIIVKE